MSKYFFGNLAKKMQNICLQFHLKWANHTILYQMYWVKPKFLITKIILTKTPTKNIPKFAQNNNEVWEVCDGFEKQKRDE